MKLFKKIMAVALTGVMALSVFTACGDSQNYSQLTDKVNDKGGYNFTYDGKTAAAAYKSAMEQFAQIDSDYDDDVDGLDPTDKDDEQKILGANVEWIRKFSNIEVPSADYVGYVVLDKNAKEDDVVASIVADLSSNYEDSVTNTFSFFDVGDYTGDICVDLDTWEIVSLKNQTLVVYVVG